VIGSGEKIGVVWSVLCVFRFTKGRSGLDDLDLHKHCSGTAIVCTITNSLVFQMLKVRVAVTFIWAIL
jgi:hypothetical protein